MDCILLYYRTMHLPAGITMGANANNGWWNGGGVAIHDEKGIAIGTQLVKCGLFSNNILRSRWHPKTISNSDLKSDSASIYECIHICMYVYIYIYIYWFRIRGTRNEKRKKTTDDKHKWCVLWYVWVRSMELVHVSEKWIEEEEWIQIRKDEIFHLSIYNVVRRHNK